MPTEQLEVSQRAREYSWPFVSRNSIAGQDREGFFAGKYDCANAVQAFDRFEREILDTRPGGCDDILYLLCCAENHADKFPVPSHMRALCARIRANLSSTPTASDTPSPSASVSSEGKTWRGPALDLMRTDWEPLIQYIRDHEGRNMGLEAMDWINRLHRLQCVREPLAESLSSTTSPSDVIEKCEDTALLDTLRDECWDLRCFDSPTGGDDADVRWRVVGHWQAEPHEREIAIGWSDDPRVAIREAIRSLASEKGQQ